MQPADRVDAWMNVARVVTWRVPPPMMSGLRSAHADVSCGPSTAQSNRRLSLYFGSLAHSIAVTGSLSVELAVDCQLPTPAPQQKQGNIGSLLDHLVRSGEQGRRDVEAESFGGLEIDRQLKFRRLLDGQVARLGACQNSINKCRGK